MSANQWQSMESAPKDGTHILTWDADELALVVHWDGAGWLMVCGGYDPLYCEPVAWQAITPPDIALCDANGNVLFRLYAGDAGPVNGVNIATLDFREDESQPLNLDHAPTG